MSTYLDGDHLHAVLPPNFTHEDLLAAGISEGDTDEVLAFREFLRIAGPVRPIKLPQPWYDYALGKISGGEALERQADLNSAADAASEIVRPEPSRPSGSET